MNYFKFYFIVFFVSVSFFFVGYKVGDSSGYAEGYEEGYRYDCKDEIAVIYNRVKSQTAVVDALNDKLKAAIHENDSLKNKEKFQQYEKDRQRLMKEFEEDASRYSLVVAYINDSLARVTGFKDIIAPNGRPNIGVCVAYDALRNLPECDPRYRVELPKKKRKGKK